MSSGAQEFLDHVNASPTPFHSVQSAKDHLKASGFKEIRERDSWASSVQPGGRYYVTRNGSSLVAFAVGGGWKPGNPIAMIGAHTDSPCLRVKPVSKRENDGFLQVGVEMYGGGLWHTWFDRDLSIAGRAIVKTDEGGFAQKLIKIDRPILRVPTLAVHLDRQETFSFNKETQLFPIAGLAAAELNRVGNGADSKKTETPDDRDKNPGPFAPLGVVTDRHHPYMVELIAKEAGVRPEQVEDFEMVLYDTQKACLGGLNDELILSARLDNQVMSFCSFQALIRSVASQKLLDSESSIRLISLFDHEEIGSLSAQGANSNMLPAIIRRLSTISPTSTSSSGSASKRTKSDDSYVNVDGGELSATAYEQTLATSFLISADMAHSVHPNYPAKYESEHRPEMNKGVVIKINANVRYATNSPGIVLLQEAARRATHPGNDNRPQGASGGVPLQLFVVRNDSSCGSTIGPMLSAALGARTLDLGNAQLSMHSIRETGGALDVDLAIALFESFFVHYTELQANIQVD